MCDTFIHVKENSVLFGKNSDREPNEAQQIVCVPKHVRKEKKVKATFIEVEHPQEIFEVILSKPFQMFGAEMGVNEHGVVIGNEAVFTKVAIDRRNLGLTGMDMLRLSLEVSRTAKEALHYLITLLEKYGQDACGGYTNKKFFYHNSFLIADRFEGYQFETAGKHWVYKKVKGHAAISNGLSIEGDYDEISPFAIDDAIKKGWYKKTADFSFREAFSQYWMPKIAACDYRRNQSFKSVTPDFGVLDAFQLLRQHHEPFEVSTSGNKSICMHASGMLCPNATVGSMVVDLTQDPTVWLTGTSTPCLSLFKPFKLGSSVLWEENFVSPSAKMDDSYWWQWESYFRNAINDYSDAQWQMKQWQNDLELLWKNQTDAGKDISAEVLLKSNQVLDLVSSTIYPKRRLGFLYDRFRNKLNQSIA